MKKSPLDGLVIRTAVVAGADLGFIYACDPRKERAEEPHTLVFMHQDGAFEQGDYNYDAHSACLIEDPDRGVVDVSEAGYYTVNTEGEMFAQDLFTNSQPPPKQPRSRGIRSVAEISGNAYAVGIRGMVYRLDQLRRWTRIDEGLPASFDAQAIHGFNSKEVYAVGRKGDLWQYDGKKWRRRDLPTNLNLTAVKCAGDGVVYIAGHAGTLLRGRDDAWVVIDQTETEDDIWDLEWFEDRLYVSTMTAVWWLDGDVLRSVRFGRSPPKSCYQLSTAEGVLWSNGEFDVMSFDGKTWSRIV